MCCKDYLGQHPERSYKSPVYIIYIYHMHNDRSLYIIIPLYIITHHNHTLNTSFVHHLYVIHTSLFIINHHESSFKKKTIYSDLTHFVEMTDLFFEAAAAVLPLDAASAMALAKGWLLGNGACGGDPQKMDA